MRKLRWSLAIVAVTVEIAAFGAWLWTRNRRMGTKLMGFRCAPLHRSAESLGALEEVAGEEGFEPSIP